MTREAFNIIGKIITGTATTRDRLRLEHLTWIKAKSLKKPRPLKLAKRWPSSVWRWE